ncbi:hypothetical protein HPB52_023209 [Rhipicephalus sanguineus]|uniref:Endonuclease/exonuclease/phosphatase domain-containing protein n=1 Tax=Rhipicephalus sanguineus TaxID=34632 RepID=A0A9D4QEQ5_RHISA|nr:hypothetical protein HPB52_023209 [Rhipicephalus sanguineus]
MLTPLIQQQISEELQQIRDQHSSSTQEIQERCLTSIKEAVQPKLLELDALTCKYKRSASQLEQGRERTSVKLLTGRRDISAIAARQQALNAPLVIVGGFNARHSSWGYPQEDIKGRKLYDLMALEGITLLTEPAYPTRTGNSVSRDTCPDLTLRHLIDPDSTRGATRRSLQRVIHGFPGDNANLLRALQSKYVNTARDHSTIHLYDGPDNPELSKAFTVVQVKAAIQSMRKGTAPGTR